MGNNLTTSGKPSQRRERTLFNRLSCSCTQTNTNMKVKVTKILSLPVSKTPSPLTLTPSPLSSTPSSPLSLMEHNEWNKQEKGPHIEQLPNDMWLEIMSYLSYNDLQQLRMVNGRCRDLVNRRCFRSKSKVIVSSHNLLDIKEYVEQGCSYLSFERMELRNLRQCDQLEHFLKLVGSQVTHLQVCHAPVFRDLDGKMPNLKMLTIATTSLLDDNHLQPVDGIDLKQFVHLMGFECDGVSMDSSMKLQMLQQLSRSENKIQLRHLQFEYRRNNEMALAQVLYDHANSLEYVDIFFSCSPGIDTYKWTNAFERMSKLQTLKLSGNCHFVLLDAIIRSIPAEAPLRQLDLTGMLSLTNELLLYVAGKWTNTMRKLDLMFCVQLNASCIPALRQLSGKLQALTMGYCRELTGLCLVEGLAYKMNSTLQELRLEEVCFIDEPSMCTILERLPNLRRLSLENCRQTVTDKTMAAICQYQTGLKDLNIDYCVKITDLALLGYGDKPYGIKRLRGLRELNLRGCRNLTDRALIEALHLPELRSLSVGYCRFQPEGIQAISHNCPSLESLCLSSCVLIDDDTVRHFMRNLKRLRCLNISNCMKLTLQSIHHIVRHGHNLTELIACSIDGVDHEVAQRILEHHRPQLKQVLL
ncbi:dynein regulatory complex subunit 6 [Drosophila willistoni]|nr:dynein regulatory complex subunit 6 [Drosophila willistoni]